MNDDQDKTKHISARLRDYAHWDQTAADKELHEEAAARIDELEATLIEIRDVALVSVDAGFYAMLATKVMGGTTSTMVNLEATYLKGGDTMDKSHDLVDALYGSYGATNGDDE